MAGELRPINEQKQTRKRVGISGMKAPAREGTEIYDAEAKNVIGKVCMYR